MRALIIVDVQYDFTTGGSLEVAGGELIIPGINLIQKCFDLVVATQDWHPPNHMSFASNHPGARDFDSVQIEGYEQTLWPDHCVQGTRGASLRDELDTRGIEAIFRKGVDAKVDSYSAFFDNRHLKSTGLTGYLRDKDVKQVFVCGIAGDICVYYTALDSQALGFETFIVEDATASLDIEVFGRQKTELTRTGVRYVSVGQLFGAEDYLSSLSP